MTVRRLAGFAGAVLLSWITAAGAVAAAEPTLVLNNWYTLMLELVRHTPTYSPPAAAPHLRLCRGHRVRGHRQRIGHARHPRRAAQCADRGAGARRRRDLRRGRHPRHGARPRPSRTTSAIPAPPAFARCAAAQEKWRALAVDGVAEDVVARSEAYGHAVAAHIIEWSLDDGGAAIENMGFPYEYDLPVGDDKWVPTNVIRQQQFPLLPEWGKNRPFAMPSGATCPTPGAPAFSTDPASDFYEEANEVYETVKGATTSTGPSRASGRTIRCFR